MQSQTILATTAETRIVIIGEGAPMSKKMMITLMVMFVIENLSSLSHREWRIVVPSAIEIWIIGRVTITMALVRPTSS